MRGFARAAASLLLLAGVARAAGHRRRPERDHRHQPAGLGVLCGRQRARQGARRGRRPAEAGRPALLRLEHLPPAAEHGGDGVRRQQRASTWRSPIAGRLHRSAAAIPSAHAPNVRLVMRGSPLLVGAPGEEGLAHQERARREGQAHHRRVPGAPGRSGTTCSAILASAGLTWNDVTRGARPHRQRRASTRSCRAAPTSPQFALERRRR